MEKGTADDLTARGIPFFYEAARIPYLFPANYLPDFALPVQCIVIEDKGAFDSADRTKMLRIKEAHPNLDIRFLFSNPNSRLSRSSKTTYGAWCAKHGFPFDKGPAIPDAWLTHSPTPAQKEAFIRIFNGQRQD